VEAHQLTAEVPEAEHQRLGKVEADIDETAAAAWGISDSELRDIQSSLADLK
jgi:hypothetical protein